MKAILRTGGGRLSFEITGEKVKDVFKEIAQIQEVFDAESKCGVCGSQDLRFLARRVDKYDFYELQCTKQGCRARFAFGQAKEGGALFPKRKVDGKWLPHGGWAKYQGEGDGDDGTPTFQTWEDADGAVNAGVPQIRVAGRLYGLDPDGANYRLEGSK